MRDQFRLTVTNSSLLIGQETYSKIQEGSAIATFLPPQVRTEDQGIIQILLENSERSNNAVQLLTAGTWTSSLIVGSMSLMWGLINSLQIIAHIPLLNVVMPANSKIIYDVIFKIANFKNPLVEPVQEWAQSKIPKQADEEEGLSYSLKNAGYTSTNPLQNNIISLILLAALLTVIIMIVLILLLIRKCIKQGRLSAVAKAYEFIKKKVFWNFFLRYSLEVYLKTIIAYTIKMNALRFGDAGQTTNSILAIFIFVTAIGYIFFVMNFLLKKFNEKY